MKQVLQGNFSPDVTWELFQSNSIPHPEKITAVIGIVLDSTNKIFLTKNARWWDLPGGHIEAGESIEQALKREVSEEAGTNIRDIRTWWYRKISSITPIKNRDGGYYPNPSYIWYYTATSTGDLYHPHGEEVIESKTFLLREGVQVVQDQVDTYILNSLSEKHK